ncbi:SCO family protein [Marinobacter sp. M216]|uniref:SCO family protein n=1 Tax=Marinobacter albus TaxID=3030833 RepID=A0ABT7H8P3_9GAMM|nr:SCO family protein [Marinobacter sp. M216]MDK9556725.1 SCO family protein [Marinobacter sp. M216]
MMPFRKPTSRFRPCVAALLGLVLTLSGCSDSETWQGKDISSLMPDLEFALTGSAGEPVTEADSAGQIRLLFFGFTSCPDVCPTTLTALSKAINQMPETLQDRVTTLFVSVDPDRDTPERIASYVDFFGENIIGLTGGEPALRDLTKRYRTTFGYDEPDADGNYQVSHSAAVYVFDGAGNARLLFRPGLTPKMMSEDLTALASEG